MEGLQLLLETSLKLFMRYGIKSVSMDDISREMGMSKKTLYQYVSDKKDLVQQAVKYHFDENEKACDILLSKSNNAIVQLVDLALHVTKTIGDINPATLYDLQKYYPEGWKMLLEHKQQYMTNCIKNNIVVGIETGMYRPEVDVKIIAPLYISMIDCILESEVFRKLEINYGHLLSHVIEYHLHALMSTAGREYYEIHKTSISI